MANIWNSWYWHLGSASFIALSGAIAFSGDCALAQITPDGTLPNNSVVTLDGNTSIINGGTTAGGNLFHSFEEFSVPTGGEAYFNNALDIQNILSRVTGGSISNIDGLLRANASANLFLINPQGIIFGPKASLNIGGSFLGSTASSLNFADGTSFSATAPTTTPLLTVSVPLGLQYGANPGRIQVQGDGHGTRTTTDLIDTTVGLRVPPNQTLAIVGGDIALLGGTLKTSGGRIELGSVAGSGLVNLTPIDSGWALGYEGVPTFADIQLSGAATVDASGAGGGNITVQGRRVTLTNGSQIQTNTLGAEPGGTLSVTASDVVELIGTSANGQSNSGLFAATYGDGNAGDLTIATGRLTVRDGANVSTATSGPGAGGRLSVSASDVVELIGTSANGQSTSGLYADTSGDGNAGDLTIATGRLTARDGANVSTSTLGTGAGGRLSVSASDVVELIGTSADGQFDSGLFAATSGDGNAGDLTIATGRLTVRDGANVSTATSGPGAGGRLSVSASDVVELIGTSANGQSNSGLFADTSGDGNAGDLTIATGRLTVQGGANVSTSTFGPGAGGRLSVSASDVVELIGTSANGQSTSGLYADTSGDGNAGDLTIATGRLTARDGANVSTSTLGTGAGGRLSVSASDVVELIGRSADGKFDSGLFAATSDDGNAGDLTIATGRLTVRDGAVVSNSTLGTGAGGRLSVSASDVVEVIGTSADGQFPSGLFAETYGDGNAGDLTIATGRLTVRDGAQVAVSSLGSGNAGSLLRVEAGSVLLENFGELLATTASGEGGNIDLQVQDKILMRQNSLISAQASGTGNGGNITINAPFMVAVPSENSDIFANAILGRGGNIFITTQGIYGQEYRSSPTSESDINASSQFGVSGTVEINNPDVDPSQGLVELPRGSSLTPAYNTVDVNRPVTEIVEAQGWIVDANGNVTLVATAPTAMPHSSWQTQVECRQVERQ